MICEAWEGLTVDGRFPLLERLDGGAGRCLFLTVRQGTHTAGIRLVVADRAEQDQYLTKWETAKALPHPFLLQMMETGRSAIRGADLAYVVMEKVEALLSGIIPDKEPSPAKAKSILDPIVDALVFVHGKGFVHGSVKPSNIVQVGEQWKLASDEMAGGGELTKLTRELDTYDAPEVGVGKLTAASDVWSLGIVAIEAFAQKATMWDRAAKGDLGVPDWLPEPFREIARGCLRWEPEERISMGEIKALLARSTPLSKTEPQLRMREPGMVRSSARAAAAVAEPIAATAGPGEEPHKNGQKATIVPALREEAASIEEEEAEELFPRSRPFSTLEGERKGVGRVIFVGVVLLVLAAAVLAVRGYMSEFWHWGETQTEARQPSPRAQAPVSETGSEKAAPPAAEQEAQQVKAPATESQGAISGAAPVQNQQPSGTQSAPASAQPIPEAQTPASSSTTLRAERQPAVTEGKEEKPKEEQEASRVANSKGTVEKRVLPSVASGASQSMRRPVEVDVRVMVDERGSVSSAEYITQSPGNYFARISHDAARAWKFQPPVSNGKPRASEWTLRFRFDRSHVEVEATEIR